MKNFSPSMRLVLVCVFLPGAAWGMGPKRPKEPAPRVLKKIVELGLIDAKPITSPAGNFDFQEAVNRQFETAASKKFAVRENTQTPPGVCVPSSTQLKLNGGVLGFEFGSGSDLNFGYSGDRDLGLVGGIQLTIKKYQMSLVMNASDVTGTSLLASAQVKQDQSELSLGLGIDFDQLIKLGWDYYSTTPLSQVAAKALDKGVSAISDKTKKIPWEGQTLYQDRQYVAIDAGQDVGLRNGDELTVQNRVHYWQGEPCESAYLGSRLEASAPATVKIYQVSAVQSWAEIENYNGEVQLSPGALATVKNLPLAPPVMP
jgi:hypothetical protein